MPMKYEKQTMRHIGDVWYNCIIIGMGGANVGFSDLQWGVVI